MKTGIRFLSIKANNIKNLEEGIINFDSSKYVDDKTFNFSYSDIVGIYGPNGTSKSTFINAITILKKLFTSVKFSPDLNDYISFDKKDMSITARIFNGLDKSIYEYTAYFKKKDEEVYLARETLNVNIFDNEKQKYLKSKVSFDIDFEDNNIKTFIKTNSVYEELTDKNSTKIGELLNLKGRKFEAKQSFVFSREFFTFLLSNNKLETTRNFIAQMILFGNYFFNVFDNKNLSQIAAIDKMPFIYFENDINNVGKLEGFLYLFKDGQIEKKYLERVLKYIEQINSVLSTIIPDLNIKFSIINESIDENNQEIVKYCLKSVKKEYEIPLRYESDGIKKIISLLSSFILTFNNQDSLLVIDELDSGIYEYLLGVLLSVFKEDGKGQLLFTSHNLRALEVIKEDILFTTNEGNNRFKKMPYIGDTNNLRSKYIRENYLKNLTFSSGIDSNRISNALTRARKK